MTDHLGNFIHDFPDCVNFNRIFKGVAKGVINHVSITTAVDHAPIGGTDDKG